MQGESNFLAEQLKLANTIHAISENLDSSSSSTTNTIEDEPTTDEVQGGPKTQELPQEEVKKSQLSSTIDICPD
ncbi:MAG TPA: hypothetical protein VGO47_04155, partial [Chlamydiales bacterium]|nr:hypothetical protein [Chlamydiales bacterium]